VRSEASALSALVLSRPDSTTRAPALAKSSAHAEPDAAE
jgi:hypothetical protein